MSFHSSSSRFPLFKLKEFVLESKYFEKTSLLTLSQQWELAKNQYLEKYPYHIAFYQFILENRDGLPYEENEGYHLLLAHVFYLMGKLNELIRMIVPSNPLLLCFQSLGNFYNGRFTRAKQLSDYMLILDDHSDPNLTGLLLVMKIWLERYYTDFEEYEKLIDQLKELYDESNKSTDQFFTNIKALVETVLVTNKKIEINFGEFQNRIANSDYWTAGLCYFELAKYFTKIDPEKAQNFLMRAKKSFESIPSCPDILKVYLHDITTGKSKKDYIMEYYPYYLVYLIRKQESGQLTEQEKEDLEKLESWREKCPKNFLKYI